jgi:glucose/arabinose dehydrogenase
LYELAISPLEQQILRKYVIVGNNHFIMRIIKTPFLSLLFVASIVSCKTETVVDDDDATNPNAKWEVQDAFTNLTFKDPVEMVYSDDGTNRLFVIEQAGVIKVFKNDPAANSTSDFLDMKNAVNSGGEKGLLGMALHPNFSSNGQLFVNYTRQNAGKLESVISRFSSDKNLADAASEEILLTFGQPYSNHNGGKIAFGKDGYLYIAIGDGGSGGDPQNFAQNLNSVLGKILRIDINKKSNGLNYAIPTDNPFVNDSNARPEIYAYGLRNPWKMNLDKETGKFWIADVGQNEKEEIDILEKGGNFGWRITEGFGCFNPSSNCNKEGLIDPVFDYGTNVGRSITGGYVYRGKIHTELTGKYIYGDYASGRIWALKYDESTKQSTNELLTRLTGSLSSFGQDKDGELYLLNYQSGKVQRLAFE